MDAITRTDLRSDFGKALRTVRSAKGVSHKDLAEAVGLRPSYVSMLEAGTRKNPSRETMEKLARALGVDVMALEVLGIKKKTLDSMEDWEVSVCSKIAYKALAT